VRSTLGGQAANGAGGCYAESGQPALGRSQRHLKGRRGEAAWGGPVVVPQGATGGGSPGQRRVGWAGGCASRCDWRRQPGATPSEADGHGAVTPSGGVQRVCRSGRRRRFRACTEGDCGARGTVGCHRRE
jgi:hypothetical protein